MTSEFIITSWILFRDKNLSRTDIDVLSLIISLALKDEYCYASNKYLTDYLNVSERTITYSLSKLKGLKYIFVKYEDNKRKIYLNVEKIQLVATNDADICKLEVAKDCDHNINNKYKREYKKKKEIVPYWMEHPEVCKSESMSAEEIAELENMLKEFKWKDDVYDWRNFIEYAKRGK